MVPYVPFVPNAKPKPKPKLKVSNMHEHGFFSVEDLDLNFPLERGTIFNSRGAGGSKLRKFSHSNVDIHNNKVVINKKIWSQLIFLSSCIFFYKMYLKKLLHSFCLASAPKIHKSFRGDQSFRGRGACQFWLLGGGSPVFVKVIERVGNSAGIYTKIFKKS